MARGVVLFDLDGTLVDSARDIAAALTRLSTGRGGAAVSAETVRPLVSLGAGELVVRALGPAAGDPTADLAQFRQLLRDLPPDPAILYAGVEAALARLVSDGRRLGMVTNKPEALARTLLAAHGLDRFFAAVVGGDTAPYPKPHPAPLLHALAALGARPTEALFVGDSAIDAHAAAALAIPLLYHRAGYGPPAPVDGHPVVEFATFGELPGLVAATGR